MIVICGATGKIGGTAARVLRSRGLPVKALVRDASQAAALHEQGCEIAQADLGDTEALTDAFRGARAVLVMVPPSPAAEDVRAAALHTIEALGSALHATAAHPRHVVAISDYGAHVPSGTGITLIFHALEACLRALPASTFTTFLRSAEHMQNWFRQLRAMRTQGILPSLHHPVTRRFPTVSAFDVGVVAAEILAAPESHSRVIHVEGPQRYSAADIAASFARSLGRSVSAQELPREQWATALAAGKLGPSYARLVCELQDAHNAGLIEVEPGGEVWRGGTELADALAL